MFFTLRSLHVEGEVLNVGPGGLGAGPGAPWALVEVEQMTHRLLALERRP